MNLKKIKSIDLKKAWNKAVDITAGTDTRRTVSITVLSTAFTAATMGVGMAVAGCLVTTATSVAVTKGIKYMEQKVGKKNQPGK